MTCLDALGPGAVCIWRPDPWLGMALLVAVSLVILIASVRRSGG